MFLCALRLPSFAPGVVPSRGSASQNVTEKKLTGNAALFSSREIRRRNIEADFLAHFRSYFYYELGVFIAISLENEAGDAQTPIF